MSLIFILIFIPHRTMGAFVVFFEYGVVGYPSKIGAGCHKQDDYQCGLYHYFNR